MDCINEEKILAGFTGKISDGLVNKKIRALKRRRREIRDDIQDITSQIYDLEDELLYEKYKDTRIQDVEEKWKKSGRPARRAVLCEPPALRRAMKSAGTERGADAGVIASEMTKLDWDGIFDQYGIHIGRFFERFCGAKDER